MDRWNFQIGDAVYSSDDHKIGTVEDIQPGYFEISTGFLGLGHHLFVPFDGVDHFDEADRRVYLNVAKDMLDARGWEERPVATSMTSDREPTLAGTMPAATQDRPAMAGTTQERPAQMLARGEDLRGRKLFAWDGKEIGSISGVGPSYADVSTGIAGLGDHLYVPFDAISYCTRDGCYLNTTFDRISSMGWNQMPAPATAAPAMAAGTGGVMNIPFYEEELQVRKHREQAGEVVVRRNVVEEQRTINVPVERQEVTIERRDVDRDVPAGATPFTEGQQEFRVPVYEERADVEKVAHVGEELVVQPERTTEQREFSDTVRREVPDVQVTGNAADMVQGEEQFARGQTAGTFRPWADVMPTYQSAWQRDYGSRGGTWQDVEPAYQFGYNAYYDPRYQNRDWASVEPDLRRDWEARYPTSPWDRFRDYIASFWNQRRRTA